MTTQQESITNNYASIKSVKSDNSPSANQADVTDVVNESENSFAQQNNIKKQELTTISNIGENFILDQTMISTPKEVDKSATAIELAFDKVDSLKGGILPLEEDLIDLSASTESNSVNDINQESVGLEELDILNDLADSNDLAIPEDIDDFDTLLDNFDAESDIEWNDKLIVKQPNTDTYDKQGSANQQESQKKSEDLKPLTNNTSEQTQEIINDSFITELDEINQSLLSDKSLADEIPNKVIDDADSIHPDREADSIPQLAKVNPSVHSNKPLIDEIPNKIIDDADSIRPHEQSDSTSVVASNVTMTQLNQKQENPFLNSPISGTSQKTEEKPQQKNKKKVKELTIFDRLLSGIFSGVIFGFGGVFIDLVVSMFRAISGMGSGDILWLFAPFLAVLGLIIGFIRHTGGDDSEVNTTDHSVYTDSGGIVQLVITTVIICAILWMILLMMS